MRKFLSGVLVFSMVFSVLEPFLANALVVDGAPENTLTGENNGYVNLVNSGAYTVNFTLSGTLDAGDAFYVEVIDGSGNIFTGSSAPATGGESTGSLFLNLSIPPFMEGALTFSGLVYTGGVLSQVAASGITSVGVLDVTVPVVSATGSYIATTTSVDFSGITLTETNFSGATLSYSGVSGGTEVGVIDLL